MRHRLLGWLSAAAVVLGLGVAGCASSSNTNTNTTTSTASAGAPGTTSASSTGATTTTSSGTVPRGGPSALSVSPPSGTPQSVIRFSFVSPGGSAEAGTLVSESLNVVGPNGTGCVGMHDEAVPTTPAGQTVNLSVGPAQIGGAWCPGTYAARVEVLARPKCGQGQMCPQFIRVVAVLGPATFRISR